MADRGTSARQSRQQSQQRAGRGTGARGGPRARSTERGTGTGGGKQRNRGDRGTETRSGQQPSSADRGAGTRGRPQSADRGAGTSGRPRRAGGTTHAPVRGTHRGPSSAPALQGPSGFTALGVPDPLAAVLQQQGITQPYPIQQATISDAIAGRDVLGRGRTGSGKTLAFSLPMVIRLSKGHRPAPRRSPRGLILVPTRELAAQVMDTLRPLCDLMGLDVSLIIGGASYDKQITRLSRGTDILVATPGRLFDLTERAVADLGHIRMVVIDEADQMADFGFLPQVEVLLEQVPAHGQRLLFSATLDDGVDDLVRRHLRDPREHATDPVAASVASMRHRAVVVPHQGKTEQAVQIVRGTRRAIVFLRTRSSVEEYAERFAEHGLASDVLHGGLSQRARQRALDSFKRGSTRVLLATDVAARGIHVDDIDVVLQFDLPNDHKDYLHRAGRTARAGARGTVVTLVTPQQQRGLARLLQRAGVEPEVEYAGGRSPGSTGRRPASAVRARRP